MRYTFLTVCIAVSIVLQGCQEKYETSETAALYIELLRSNRYDSLNLPALSAADIPTLLHYRNETQLISTFPRNMISSFWQPEVELGVYVLWTIESIRAVSAGSDNLIGRFPSQNPVLALRDADVLELVNDAESHEKAAKAYYKWWTDNSRKSFDKFNSTDPLAGTPYRWH